MGQCRWQAWLTDDRLTQSAGGLRCSRAGSATCLEWYDFGLYGLFAPILAPLFFPAHDRIASLIGAYSGFAIGFAARPLGGVVFGHLGDRVGRRAVHVCSVVHDGLRHDRDGVLARPTRRSASAHPCFCCSSACCRVFRSEANIPARSPTWSRPRPTHRRGFAGSVANIGATVPACCSRPALSRRLRCSLRPRKSSAGRGAFRS